MKLGGVMHFTVGQKGLHTNLRRTLLQCSLSADSVSGVGKSGVRRGCILVVSKWCFQITLYPKPELHVYQLQEKRRGAAIGKRLPFAFAFLLYSLLLQFDLTKQSLSTP